MRSMGLKLCVRNQRAHLNGCRGFKLNNIVIQLSLPENKMIKTADSFC